MSKCNDLQIHEYCKCDILFTIEHGKQINRWTLWNLMAATLSEKAGNNKQLEENVTQYHQNIQIIWRYSCVRGTINNSTPDLWALRWNCIKNRHVSVMEISAWDQEHSQKSFSVNTIHPSNLQMQVKALSCKEEATWSKNSAVFSGPNHIQNGPM